MTSPAPWPVNASRTSTDPTGSLAAAAPVPSGGASARPFMAVRSAEPRSTTGQGPVEESACGQPISPTSRAWSPTGCCR
ncbi:hypothetical protein AQJ58_38035 [Streptomyces sp. DSM 15324]|nr:hypothetical protein AQJ58_38035 [Streptomyces sp. DSM 15324]